MAFIRITARGSSMWPTLRDGDVLLVARAAPVRPGDVVLVRALDAGGLVAHRLAAKTDTALRCANSRGEPDPWVPMAALFGRVEAIERGGRLLPIKREPPGMRMLWRLRQGYGLARRVGRRLRSFA